MKLPVESRPMEDGNVLGVVTSGPCLSGLSGGVALTSAAAETVTVAVADSLPITARTVVLPGSRPVT